MPLMYILWGFNQALFSPTVHEAEGFLFYYPLYIPKWLQSFYTCGSFYLVYINIWYAKRIYNSKFSERWYQILVGGSMWAYLTHYLWIIIFVKHFVVKYETRDDKLELAQAAPLTFIGTEIQIFASQALVTYLVSLCKKRKGRETRDAQRSQELQDNALTINN